MKPLETTSPKPRLHHFDMLRGVAILLVVTGHIISLSIREIDRAFAFKFIELVELPIFFFVSGWFSFKINAGGQVRFPNIGKRFLQLVIPMVVVSSLWVLYFPHSGLQSPFDDSFIGLWTNDYKYGYWFNLGLFENVLLFALAVPLLRLCKSPTSQALCLTGFWIAFYLLSLFLPRNIGDCFSLSHSATFSAAFLFGVWASAHKGVFKRFAPDPRTQSVAVPLFAILTYLCCYWWEFPALQDYLFALKGLNFICLMIILLPIFEQWSAAAIDVVNPNSYLRPAACLFQYLGKQSLGIYLLHYFFLFPLGGVVRPTFEAMNVGFVPLTAFSICVAAVVIAFTLLVIRLIDRAPLIAYLLTGKMK